MINIQGHTSAACQNMYSGLKPGNVHHQATVHDSRFAGLFLTLPTLTSPRSPLDPCSSAHSRSCWVPLQKAVILLEKTTLNPKHHLSCRFAFWKWIQESSYPRDPKSHIFRTCFPSRRDFRNPSSDLVDWRVICLLPIRLCVSENKVRVTWQTLHSFQKPLLAAEACEPWNSRAQKRIEKYKSGVTGHKVNPSGIIYL